jgi:NAD kinase
VPEPDNSPSHSEKYVDENLIQIPIPEALAAYRLGATLLQRSPDQIAEALDQLEEQQLRLAVESLRAVAEAGPGLARLLEKLDYSSSEEATRRPTATEPQRIAFERVLILRKESKVQYDMRKQGFESTAELRSWYEEQGLVDVDGIFERHRAHLASVAELEGIVGDEHSYIFGALSEEERRLLLSSNDFDLIVSLGGDDTAKDISRYISDQYFLILNSDEIGSVGALASHIRPQFFDVMESVRDGNFLIEEWPRLEAEVRVAGEERTVTSPPALNEIEIGDMYTRWPFRGVLLRDGKEATPIKGNGIIFSVPSGLTGWFTSESEGIYPLGHTRPRTDKTAEFVIRGRYRFGESSFEDLVDDPDRVSTRPGILKEGEEIVVRSTSNHSATINVDSVWEYRFPRGSEAVIRQTEVPLKVISRKSGLKVE